MPTDPSLYLHEELTLLALRDREGTFVFGLPYNLAIAGAILAELTLAGRVAIEEGEKKRVEAVDRTPLGEPLLDQCLAEIADANRPQKAPGWVARLSHQPRLAHRVAEGLCRRGVLRIDEKKVLLVFSRTIYPEVDSGPERALIERLRTAIFEDGDVEPRTAIALSLADSCRLLEVPFERRELKRRRRRIRAIGAGEATGAATREAIEAAQAAQAAAMAAITAATAATTVVTTS